MHELNEAMIAVNLRRFTCDDGDGYDSILSDHRINPSDAVWLSSLNKPQLKALNRLPVGLYRIFYDTMVIGKSYLDDEQFKSANNKITMVMESINFVFRNRVHPLVGIGFDRLAFDQFANAPFGRRQLLVSKGGFSIGIRSNLRALLLDANNPGAQLADTLRIILGDLRYFTANKKATLGQVRDWDRQLIPLDEIARQILIGGIQPKLVALHTGLSLQRVDNIKRVLHRGGHAVPSQVGRIQVPAKMIKNDPLHALLFLSIYLLLANQATTRVNAHAVVVASEQYRLLSEHCGIHADDILSPSNCWVLANALRSRELRVEPCRSCNEVMIQSIERPMRCLWCNH